MVPELAVDCGCRKPKTGMIEKAAADLDLDPKRSFVVGDKYSDVQLGFAVGARGVLVLTGYGRGELQWFGDTWEKKPSLVAENLGQVVDYVLETVKNDG